MAGPDPSPPRLRPDAVSPDPGVWLTTHEAAGKLGLTPKTLANMRTLGKGPCFHKIGGKVWYRGQDILTYQRRRRYIASGVRDEG
ncbi:MAG: helix-turn-helix domain-containing protein [Hyphomonas sp.]|nr:helix-turn-helix domain-containing protein [Hyphomonas sp.]